MTGFMVTQNRKLGTLLLLHLLCGLGFWYSISRLGLGLSTDSVHLLFSGANLVEGRGLVSFDGSPVLLWPPLYPVLMGLLHLLTGMSTFAAAHVLQAAAWVALSISLSLLYLRLFPNDFALAIAATVLSDIGVVVVSGFALLGSDYLFLSLVVLMAVLTGCYLERPSGRLYIAVFIAAMLAALQRYLGVAAVAAAAASLALLSKTPVPRRLLNSAFMPLAALPAALWYLRALPLVPRRAPVAAADNARTFVRSVLEWFAPPDAVHITSAAVASVAILLLVLLLLAAIWVSRRAAGSFIGAPLLLFGVFYVAALFGSAGLAYYNKLAGRFLLPLYIPFATGLVTLVSGLPRLFERGPRWLHMSARPAGLALLGITAVLLLRTTVPFIEASHAGEPLGENAFNTLEWRRDRALQFWSSHTPAGPYRLFSNVPDACAFYTGHACLPAPRKFSGPYGTEQLPLESYGTELFHPGEDVYLIWFDPGKSTYYYRPEELGPIADVARIFAWRGSEIYRLWPIVGQPQGNCSPTAGPIGTPRV